MLFDSCMQLVFYLKTIDIEIIKKGQLVLSLSYFFFVGVGLHFTINFLE